jgi:hypothetical protein
MEHPKKSLRYLLAILLSLVSLAGVGFAQSSYTLFSSSTVPANPNAYVGGPYEFGMRFTADQNGQISALRFYKGSSNTGTHVGNLWSSTGQLLASATFTNETASGWQQVSLTSPVAITANTVYVVSYHESSGYYSADYGYFSNSIDNPPLHAPANSNGNNGVYVSSANSAFPLSSGSGANYWVDVVFTPNSSGSLVSIAVTPANPSIAAGSAQQFQATGTYSDNSTQNLTSQVSWLSANTTVATITGAGLATGNTVGSSLITATLNGISGTATLTVTNAPPQSYTLFSSSAVPANPNAYVGGPYEFGMRFTADQNGQISALRFYKGSSNTGTHVGNLWSSTGQLLASATFTNETASGWQQESLTSPVAITANTVYVVSYHESSGYYSADYGYFSNPIDNPPLHAPANSNGNNGVYVSGANSAFPQSSGSGANYWVDVVFTPLITVTASGVTASNKSYDGTTVANLSTAGATLSGVLPADAGNVMLTGGTGTFASANVGTGITVTVTGLSLTGSAAGKYQLSSNPVTAAANISPVPLVVTANNQSRAYGAANPALTGTLTGVVSGDNITATYATAATPTSPVGTYPITATLSDPNSKLGNYVVSNTPGTLTITDATPAISWANPAPITYGTPLSSAQLNASFSVPGSCSYTPVSGTVLAGGTHTLSVICTPTDTTDYTSASASVPLTVNAAATNTSLSISPAGPVTAGTVVTVTATPTSGGAAVGTGQVTFCEASAAYCEDAAVLGRAWVTHSGAASLNLRLAIGAHNIKAVFAGTNSYTSSTSTPQSVTVTASSPVTTATALASSGSPGSYTLTATVAGYGAPWPTGTVSFVDGSNNNYVLASTALAPGTIVNGFVPAASAATGNGPNAIAVGDFNGDGKPDLAVVNFDSNTVTILLGNGDGTFTVGPTLATGSYPTAVAVGDFNGDGKLDLAVTNLMSNTVTIFLGNGDGTFTPAASPATGGGPVAIAVGDFNGDGKPDLAVVNFGDYTVTILLGNGDGTFTAAAASPAVGSSPRSIAVGDFNGDGKLDLAVVDSSSNTVTILLGNGDGTFTAAAPLATGSYPISVAVGDFNGDGKADLAVANYDDNTVTIFLGNGDGTFTPAAPLATGSSPKAVVVGDFNGDGKLDLAVANFMGSTVTILLGNGDGTFTAAPSSSTGIASDAIAVGDFNGDGRADLAITNSSANTATVLLQQATAQATVAGISILGNGTHNILAGYVGDVNYAGSQSSPAGLTASPIPTSTTLSAVPGAAVTYGTPVTLTATISPYLAAGYTATGVVTFNDGGTTLGPGTISNGTATYAAPALGAGSHSITAVYSGDADFAGSTQTVPINVNAVTVTPILTVNDKVYDGTNVAVIATGALTGVLSGDTGNVALTGGTATFATANVGNGITVTVTGLSLAGSAAGNYQLSTTSASATANIRALTVTPIVTVADKSYDATTAAKVTGWSLPEVLPQDTGNVSLTCGAATFASANVGNAITVTVTGLSLTSSAAGNYQLSSTSATTTANITILTVNVDLSISPSGPGTVVTLMATLTSAGVPVSAGQVTFREASAPYLGAVLGTVWVTRNGTATLKVPLRSGTHNVEAVFTGTNAYAGTTSQVQPITVTSSPLTTTTSITSSGYPADYTLTATVVGNGALPITGMASFYDTSNSYKLLASAVLTPESVAYRFTAAQPAPPSTPQPQRLVVGDFNGDGFADLAVANFSSNTVTILLGNGDGTFTALPPAQWQATGNSPSAIAVGDFNGDGKLDLAIVNSADNTVSILLGNGDGTFQVQTTYATGRSPSSIVIGDFNGDGYADLAVLNSNDSTVTILLGNGDGTFTAQPPAQWPATGSSPSAIAVGDFNGDGKLDLAVTNTVSNTVTILLGNGDGTFTAGPTLATGSYPTAVAVGDFNGDGKLDLAIANDDDNTVTILLGNGDGTFKPSSQLSATGLNPDSIVVGDLNGDGYADLAVANGLDGTVTILLGNGGGTFTTLPSSQSPAAGPSAVPLSIAIGDFNGDGSPDLAVGGATLAVFLQQATFSSTTSVSGISIPGVGAAHSVVAAYAGDSSYALSQSGPVQLTPVGAPPSISTLSPTSGQTGILVTITGSNFGVTPAMVTFGGTVATGVITWSQDSIEVAVPSGATTGAVVVTTNGMASTENPLFTVVFPTQSPASVTYTYDSQGRIWQAIYATSTGGTVTTTYSYDSAGNRTSVTTQ